MTISDIAKMAGVSSAAVSRYLNGGPLSEQKRAVIHEVVEKTGYRPDTAAQTLRTGKVNQVGVIAPSIGSQSVGQITAGIASELDAKSYLMLLGNTELDAQRELGYLTAMQLLYSSAGAGAEKLPCAGGGNRPAFSGCGLRVQRRPHCSPGTCPADAGPWPQKDRLYWRYRAGRCHRRAAP